LTTSGDFFMATDTERRREAARTLYYDADAMPQWLRGRIQDVPSADD
jgi:hypothetical protein